MKKQNAITLIALVISIIVLVILAGVTIVTLIGDNGLITRSGSAKEENLKAVIREKIQTESAGLEPERQLKTKTDGEIFQLLQGRLDLEEAQYNIGSKSMTITTKEGFVFTVLYDGIVRDGKFACLDIAEGSIQLKSTGYIQGENELVQYDGDYIITGATTENVLEVKEEGTYNIIIKDLRIDVSNLNNKTAFNANAGNKTTRCNVNLTVEGNNYLEGTMNGLRFAGALANVGDVKNGSTLTIEGNGSLEAKGGNCRAGIGGGNTNNIIINSGTIIASSVNSACGIGSDVNGNANNIVINGGNITAYGGAWSSAIGAYNNVDNLVINGGKIIARSNYYCLGGRTGGLVKITGGEIDTVGIIYIIQDIVVEGGTIKNIAASFPGMCCRENGNIKITGGNVFTRGKDNINTAKYSDSAKTYTSCNPTDEINNLYETQIKLNDVGDGKKITSIVTNDNINYGINDMYTLEEGMLYLYLPIGTRTISITTEDGTYTGSVETVETQETPVTLTKIN